MTCDSVMCTVQGCHQIAAFAFKGVPDGTAGKTVVAAYCESHASEVARRAGHPWPASECDSERVRENSRALRAG